MEGITYGGSGSQGELLLICDGPAFGRLLICDAPEHHSYAAGGGKGMLMICDAPVKKRAACNLCDVLFFVSAQGFGDIVARYGVALDRYTWANQMLWRSLIDVWFGEEPAAGAGFYESSQSTRRTRLMIYSLAGRHDLVTWALKLRAQANLGVTAQHPNHLHLEEDEKIFTVRNPLSSAVESESLETVQIILEHGADPNQSTFTSSQRILTPLASAVCLGLLPVVKLLVETYKVEVKGATKGLPGVSLNSLVSSDVLASAINHGHVDIARYFIVDHKVCVNFPNPNVFEFDEEAGLWQGEIEEEDLVSFMQAAFEAEDGELSIEMIRLLLENGAKTNFLLVDESDTCLFEAVSRKRLDIVNLLLSYNADPNLFDDWIQNTPLLRAAELNEPEIATALVGAGASVFAAIMHQEFHDTSCALTEGFTPLHYFAQHGNAKLVALLLKAGAEFDALTFSGYTPFILCVKGVGTKASHSRLQQAAAVCSLLYQAGANASRERMWGEGFGEFATGKDISENKHSAVTYAVDLNADSLLTSLCYMGCELHKCDRNNCSLIMRAAEKGFERIVRILINKSSEKLGAFQFRALLEKRYVLAHEVDDDDDMKNGQNALFLCMKGDDAKFVNNVVIARLLINAGIPFILDRYNRTPLDFACETKSTEIYELIYNHQTRLVCLPEATQIALFRNAVERDATSIVKFILEKISVPVLSKASFSKSVSLAGTAFTANLSALCFAAFCGRKDMCTILAVHLGKETINSSFEVEKQIKINNPRAAGDNPPVILEEVWSCPSCTFQNASTLSTFCAMCGGPQSVASNAPPAFYFIRKHEVYTALTLALEFVNNNPCVEVLLNLGASPLHPHHDSDDFPDTSFASSPLGIALRKKNRDHARALVHSLSRLGLLNDCLVEAVKENSSAGVEVLTIGRSLTSSFDDPTKSPLHVAFALKRYDLVRMLASRMAPDELNNTVASPGEKITLLLETTVPRYRQINPWRKENVYQGLPLTLKFLGHDVTFTVPDEVAPGQKIRIAETFYWDGPESCFLDAAFCAYAAAGHGTPASNTLLELVDFLMKAGARLARFHDAESIFMVYFAYCTRFPDEAGEYIFERLSYYYFLDHKFDFEHEEEHDEDDEMGDGEDDEMEVEVEDDNDDARPKMPLLLTWIDTSEADEGRMDQGGLPRLVEEKKVVKEEEDFLFVDLDDDDDEEYKFIGCWEMAKKNECGLLSDGGVTFVSVL